MSKKLSPQELYPIEDWIYDATSGYTKLGYEEWVAHNVESHKKPTKIKPRKRYVISLEVIMDKEKENG